MENPSANNQAIAGQTKHYGDKLSPLGAFIGFTVAGAFLLIAISTAFLSTQAGNSHPIAVGVLFYLSAATVAGFCLKRSYEHAILGLCNIVTLARLVFVGVLVVALINNTPPNWVTFSTAAFALALDGIDGWLARRQGLASAFGAQFDVEVDAVFALVLALYAASNGAASPFVILLGLPHYLFWIARLQFPWLNGDLPHSLARKAVCVFQIAALIVLQVPFLPDGALDIMIGAVMLALIWSFGRDIIWLRRAYA